MSQVSERATENRQESRQIEIYTPPDKRTYGVHIDRIESEIGTADRQIEDIDRQAKLLFESKGRIEATRQRLITMKNAARAALRFIEDSETGVRGTRG